MNTPYKDKNELTISVGDILNINCAPHHGEYVVCFGEYQHQNFTKHDRQSLHFGFYLERIKGKDVVSLAHCMKQPKGYGASNHTLEIKEVSLI